MKRSYKRCVIISVHMIFPFMKAWVCCALSFLPLRLAMDRQPGGKRCLSTGVGERQVVQYVIHVPYRSLIHVFRPHQIGTPYSFNCLSALHEIARYHVRIKFGVYEGSHDIPGPFGLVSRFERVVYAISSPFGGDLIVF